MTALASAKRDGWPLVAFLREELAPRPGRLAAVARIATCCTIVVATAMLYQIPEPAYAAYIVFFLGRGDTAVTVRTGLAGGVAATLATVLTLFLYTLDASEPALRLPLMAGSAFLGMFLLRTIAIGPIAFLVGFLMVVEQSLIEVFPNLEALTRFVLWLWVVILLPDAVTVIINLLAGPRPAALARTLAIRLLDALADALRRGDMRPLAGKGDEALELAELRQRESVLERSARAGAAHDAALIEVVDELIALATLLPVGTEPKARLALAQMCIACREMFIRGTEQPPPMTDGLTEEILASLAPDERPVVVAMRRALRRLETGLAARAGAHRASASPAPAGLLVPDAFTNPEHWRFALKTTVAAMASYIIYTGADWPGIRTALITCFFVAVGTLGETVHKLTLRVSGAAIGGLVGGLCIVYLLPMMTDIGDLSLLIFVASAGFAWVATSSEWLAYAGMQMALAFYLGVLQAYGPATDLTALRDRMVGLLLGNVLMSVAFSVLWPVSAAAQARASLAAALRSLGALLLDPLPRAGAGRRLAVARAIARARQLMSFAAFETGFLPPHAAQRRVATASLEPLDRAAAVVFVVAEHTSAERDAEFMDRQDKAIATWFDEAATCLQAGRALPCAPDSATLTRTLSALSPPLPIETRSAFEARLLLLSTIEGVATDAGL